MNQYLTFFTVLVALATPLVGQGARELRNPTPKELIAQLLLRRSQSAQKRGGGGTSHAVSPVYQPSSESSSKSSSNVFDERINAVDHAEIEAVADFLTCSGSGCGEGESFTSRWSMPLMKLGDKRYYLGIFFKYLTLPNFGVQKLSLSLTCLEHPLFQANWFKASQYCRYHGMHLASIENGRENSRLEGYVQDLGLGHEHFWTSGTDQGEEGRFFWMSNGRPVTFTNWNAGEPNNFEYENGEQEHCLELWNRDGKGLKWNDSPCSFETFFICEVA